MKKGKSVQEGGGAPKGLIARSLHNIVTSVRGLNDSKFFMGAVMIMMNIASKHISIDLTPSQQKYFKNNIARQLLIFAIATAFVHEHTHMMCFNSFFYLCYKRYA